MLIILYILTGVYLSVLLFLMLELHNLIAELRSVTVDNFDFSLEVITLLLYAVFWPVLMLEALLFREQE
jgi:hypothetical protein